MDRGGGVCGGGGGGVCVFGSPLQCLSPMNMYEV